MADLHGREIWFLAQRVPYPPDRGDRITTSHLCAHLRDSGARLRVGCFAESDADLESARHLTQTGIEVCARRIRPRLRKAACLPWLFSRSALTLPYFHDRALVRRLSQWADERRPDLCFAYSSSMGQYVLGFGDRIASSRKVMHFAELDSDKWAQYARATRPPQRWLYEREARRLLAFERRLAVAMDLNLVVSSVEQELFERQIPGARVATLTNGVDLGAFHPASPGEPRDEAVVFTGVMNYLPNVDAMLFFAARAWPRVRRHRPDARLYIVGSEPARELRRLNGQDGIRVTGRVPETQPWLRRARAAVAPLRIARGLQNKVLEAMASGLPVVASPQAAEGIEAEVGTELLVAEDGPAFADAITGLLADPTRAEEIGRLARARVEKSYDWSRILARFDSLLAGLTDAR